MSKKVVIDAGHGGSDSGTVANGITEKDYALKISKYIENRLNEMGIENSLTRNGDITLNSNDRTKKAQDFYGKGSDVIILSNHINAGGGESQSVTNKLELEKFEICYFIFIFSIFNFSFSNSFKDFWGVGNFSGIVPPFLAITSLIFFPIL